MTIEQARKLLKKDGENLTDKEILELINSATILSDIFLDMWFKMTPQERTDFRKRKKP